MRITYYALKSVLVGDDQREAGDLVPEARDWPYLNGYLSDGVLAPVLVATLPEEQQMMLLEWEEDQDKSAAEAQAQAEKKAKAAAKQQKTDDAKVNA